jgi:ATP-dependent RNA helicase DDX1
MTQCMIFCRTNLDCQNLSKFLQQQTSKNSGSGSSLLVSKYSHRILGGQLSMEERRKSLQLFKDGEIRLLICTDIASRGIDVDSLPYVINLTLPAEEEDYVHRIGRVGRSDRMGLAISLVSSENEEKVWYHTCKNRGQNCSNRRLVDDNGCTIWFSEPELLQKIQKKINQPLLFMSNDSLELPEEILKQKIIYGVSMATQSEMVNSRIYMNENMKENVKQLMTLEFQTQQLFLQSMLMQANSVFEPSSATKK